LKTAQKPGIYVLVVEDELLSRLHAASLVEDAGYSAIEAANADEAIAILEARKDIRIVFTDIDMPGSMDGLKLARAIRNRWPPIELILTSGHFSLRNGDLPARGRFLRQALSRRRDHLDLATVRVLTKALHRSLTQAGR
jgi:CheY-like chemotaxis protein